MLESESCKSSINGEGEGEFRKEHFFPPQDAPSLALLLGTCKGFFLKVKLTNSVFKHSPKERGKHLADCVKVSKLHFVSSTL